MREVRMLDGVDAEEGPQGDENGERRVDLGSK